MFYDFSIRRLHCVALVVILHNKLRMLQIPSLVFEGVLFGSAVNREEYHIQSVACYLIC